MTTREQAKNAAASSIHDSETYTLRVASAEASCRIHPLPLRFVKQSGRVKADKIIT